jgi:hypothetical protein
MEIDLRHRLCCTAATTALLARQLVVQELDAPRAPAPIRSATRSLVVDPGARLALGDDGRAPEGDRHTEGDDGGTTPCPHTATSEE